MTEKVDFNIKAEKVDFNIKAPEYLLYVQSGSQLVPVLHVPGLIGLIRFGVAWRGGK